MHGEACPNLKSRVITNAFKFSEFLYICRARNATELLQVVEFSKPFDFIELQLHQVCENQICSDLIFADTRKQAFDNWQQTCFIKPEQAMRTHPDIGSIILDLAVSPLIIIFRKADEK